MWQQNYTPVAGSLALSALVAAIPIFALLVLIGVIRKPAWMASLVGLGTAALVAARRLRHALGQAGGIDYLRRGIRPVPHRMGGLLRHPALSHHARERQVRDAQGFHRAPHQRCAAASAADRVRVRRVYRRRRGIRHAGGGGVGDAGGSGLRAVLRGGHLPAGQYGAGGFRFDRDPHHHAGGDYRSAAGPPERRGGPHLRAGLAHRAGLSDPGDVGMERTAGRSSRRGGLRHRLCRDAIRDFEFR